MILQEVAGQVGGASGAAGAGRRAERCAGKLQSALVRESCAVRGACVVRAPAQCGLLLECGLLCGVGACAWRELAQCGDASKIVDLFHTGSIHAWTGFFMFAESLYWFIHDYRFMQV